jgi:peroxiredoxin
MNLTAELTKMREEGRAARPDNINEIIDREINRLSESGMTESAPKAGQTLMDFKLPNQNGNYVHLQELREQGPVVIIFYRGGWCPYCNLELRAYQEVLADIKATGAKLVAITPELPDSSLTTAEKNELQYDILTDENMEYASRLGLSFTLPESVREIYDGFGIDLQGHNGIGKFNLPLAATFVVDTNGMIISSFVKVDYTYRKSPMEVVAELKSLYK